MTDTTRDAFEAEAKTLAMNLERLDQVYVNESTGYGWVMWQAATLAAMRQPLTVKQIEDLWSKWVGTPRANISLVRVIEIAHGIKP